MINRDNTKRLVNIKKFFDEMEDMDNEINNELDTQTYVLNNIHNDILDTNKSQIDSKTRINKMLNKCRCTIC